MATNVSNDLSYYVVIARKDKEDLANIRHWQNLKVGFDGDFIWLKQDTRWHRADSGHR